MRKIRKMKFVLNFSAIFILSVLCIKATAQSSFNLDNTTSGIKLYHQIVQCNGSDVVFLKFENTTTQNITISFNQVFDTQLEKGIVGFKGVKKILLLPGVTLQANCEDKTHPECIVTALDASPAYSAKLLAFSFANINVVTMQ